MSNNLVGRNFTASIKPALTSLEVDKLGQLLDGVAVLWSITHDKDFNPLSGEIIDPHTHVLIFYKNPSRLNTVANLLGVASNFIEVVSNKSAMLKYLTHINDKDKYQYSFDSVFTNGVIDYKTAIQKDSLSNREIINLLKTESAIELVDLVPAYKLANLQRIAFYDANNKSFQEIVSLNDKMTNLISLQESTVKGLANLEVIADTLLNEYQKLSDYNKKMIDSILPNMTTAFIDLMQGFQSIMSPFKQLQDVKLIKDN